jgi:CheY-like chemotaxis protein
MMQRRSTQCVSFSCCLGSARSVPQTPPQLWKRSIQASLTRAPRAPRRQSRTRLGRLTKPLITDVVMPDMSGTELASRAVAIHPALRIVFASGNPLPEGFLAFRWSALRKPYTLDELQRTLRSASDRYAAGPVNSREPGGTGEGSANLDQWAAGVPRWRFCLSAPSAINVSRHRSGCLAAGRPDRLQQRQRKGAGAPTGGGDMLAQKVSPYKTLVCAFRFAICARAPGEGREALELVISQARTCPSLTDCPSMI